MFQYLIGIIDHFKKDLESSSEPRVSYSMMFQYLIGIIDHFKFRNRLQKRDLEILKVSIPNRHYRSFQDQGKRGQRQALSVSIPNRHYRSFQACMGVPAFAHMQVSIPNRHYRSFQDAIAYVAISVCVSIPNRHYRSFQGLSRSRWSSSFWFQYLIGIIDHFKSLP